MTRFYLLLLLHYILNDSDNVFLLRLDYSKKKNLLKLQPSAFSENLACVEAEFQ